MKVNTLPLLLRLKLGLDLVFALSALVIPCCFVAGHQSQLDVLLVSVCLPETPDSSWPL